MFVDLSSVVEGKQYRCDGDIEFDPSVIAGRGSFAGSAHFEGSYSLLDGILFVKGKLNCTVESSCDRCGDPVTVPMIVKVDVTFHKDEGETKDQYIYEKNGVYLDDMLTEQFLFAFPSSVLCKNDCKGICQKCGCNKNVTECHCDELPNENSPFAILKSIVGGAKNGSTKV